MARFIFNQTVKHGTNTYSEGDVSTISDELAGYFASNSWGYIEGQDIYNGDPILNPDIEPVSSKPIVDTVLEIHNSNHGLKDSNDG